MYENRTQSSEILERDSSKIQFRARTKVRVRLQPTDAGSSRDSVAPGSCPPQRQSSPQNTNCFLRSGIVDEHGSTTFYHSDK